ncbi:MAG: 50S ribosomal protein L11 methyltransferase [Persephonella sp.]|nr:50S ribosomal protein L11 methyltransferase [Persephonella sp.]
MWEPGLSGDTCNLQTAKLGADVYAVDVQEEAVKECSENGWENEVPVRCEKKSVEQIEDKFDVVIANLQMDIFRNYFDKITQLFKEHLIITGIYVEKKERDEILSMADSLKLSVKKEISKKDINKEGEKWYGFIFEHQ